MAELKERFSMADEIGTPDLWTEARRRAMAPQAPSHSLPSRSDRRKRGVAAIVAISVFAAAAVFAWNLSHPDRQPSPAPAVDLAAELPEGWSELPAPPEVRSGAATAWTGSELLVWGGYEFIGSGDEDPASDGFVFDGATRTWGALPDSPLSGRSDAASTWTGDELLIWGGFDGGFRDVPYFDDGAAFDPLTRKWRMLPAAPISARAPFSVWTGQELIVWGSADRFARLPDGAAYDPTTNTWRTIADGLIDITDGSAVWTGREMIVFGAALDGNNHPDTPTAIGAAYDPLADAWRELPPSELSPQAHTAEWVNGELVAWDYEHGTATYDPGTDAWRTLPDVPLSFSECGPESAATAQLVFGNYCGQTVLFSSDEGVWGREPIPDLEGEGCCRVLEPVAAGNVILVPSHSYGMGLGEPDRRLAAYNPPAVVRTDPRGDVLEPEPFIPLTERDGDRILLPITFPDGREGTLSYPIPLDLATLGLQPDVSYVWKENPPPRFPLRFLHDPNASIAEYVEGREPVGEVAGQIERIEVWKARGNDVERRFWLRFELPSWTVLVSVPDALTSAEQVASSLLLRETEGGFPVALASGPIELSAEAGEAEGPVLSIGSVEGIIEIFPESCSGSPSGELAASHQHFSRCFGSRIFMTVVGDPPFVTAVSDGIEIEASWSVEPTSFVPDANVADGIAHAALTFPNGATATLAYRSTFGLVDYGVQPDDAWVLPGEIGPTPIMFVHGPSGVEGNYVLGGEPVAHARSASGQRLPVWQAVRISGQVAPSHWLVHRVGSWTILVGLPEERWAVEVATSIVIHVDSNGMPWVEALGRLESSPSAGEGGGAQLTVGDRDPTPRSLLPYFAFATIEMNPFGCDERPETTGSNGGGDMFAVLCLGGGNVAVEVNGDQQVVESLIEELRIEDFASP